MLHPEDYSDDLFTIEEYDEDRAYAKPKGEKVAIGARKQNYEIVDAGNSLYK